ATTAIRTQRVRRRLERGAPSANASSMRCLSRAGSSVICFAGDGGPSLPPSLGEPFGSGIVAWAGLLAAAAADRGAHVGVGVQVAHVVVIHDAEAPGAQR